jgi:hypothetical protein
MPESNGISLDVAALEAAALRNIVEFWECELDYSNADTEPLSFHDNSIVAIRALIHVAAIPLIDSSPTTLMLLSDVAAINGHAFLHDGHGVAFYLIKRNASPFYHTVFALHEILHAVHYRESSEFAFDTKAWKKNTGRQLISEGISTVLCALVLKCELDIALWADVLSIEERNAWMMACEHSKDLLCKLVLDNFDDSAPIGLFEYEPNQSPQINRGGYWLGAMFIQELILNGYTPEALLAAKYSHLRQLALHWLEVNCTT